MASHQCVNAPHTSVTERAITLSVLHQSYRSRSPPASPYVDTLGVTPLIYPKDQCPRLRLMLTLNWGEDAVIVGK